MDYVFIFALHLSISFFVYVSFEPFARSLGHSHSDSWIGILTGEGVDQASDLVTIAAVTDHQLQQENVIRKAF